MANDIYLEKQLRDISADEQPARIKIYGDNNLSTNWLCINDKQLEEIKKIILTKC